MAITRRKALYIFLSSLLGMLLLLMFHRAVFVIYDILGSFYPDLDFLHITPALLFSLDFFSMILAVFIGGWYGVWLGLNWYHMIYEERGVTTWFHGFVPYRWRKLRDKKQAETFLEEILSKSTPVAPKRIVVNAPAMAAKTEKFRTYRAGKISPVAPSWSIEDMDTQSVKAPAKKRVAKKKVAKKTVRKAQTRKKAVALVTES